jgi:hypothetical protein
MSRVQNLRFFGVGGGVARFLPTVLALTMGVSISSLSALHVRVVLASYIGRISVHSNSGFDICRFRHRDR